MNHAFSILRATAALLLVALCGCSSLKPTDFTAAVPRFEPEKFFEGPVRSWGVIETRSGRPQSRVRADLNGRREGNEVEITQNFTFEDGRKEQRIWRIKRVDEHRYEATANGVIGPATGYAYGNSFHWVYTLQLRPGNRLTRVRMEHWMYLLGDDKTVLNRVIIRKLGVVVAQTTEYFQKGTPIVPTTEAR